MKILSGEKISFKIEPFVNVKNDSNVFLTLLKRKEFNELYERYGIPFKLDKVKFKDKITSVIDINGNINDYDLVKIRRVNKELVVIKYKLNFSSVGNQKILLSYQSYSDNDSCVLLGVDINPAGYSGKRFYLRFLTDQLK